jgi:hypothetical protein
MSLALAPIRAAAICMDRLTALPIAGRQHCYATRAIDVPVSRQWKGYWQRAA